MTNFKFYTNKAEYPYSNGFWRSAIMAVIAILMLGTSAFSQGNKPSASLEQIRNGGADKPVDPAQWQNGNAGNQTAHYVEGHSIGYRTILTNLPVGTHIELTLGYDVRHSSKNAIDFLTHFDRLQPHGQFLLGGIPHPAVQERVDPTIGFSQFRTSPSPGGALDPTDTYTIPRPIVNTTSPPIPGQPDAGGVPGTAYDRLSFQETLMSIWGASFENITGLTPATAISYVGEANLNVAQSEQRIKVAFKTPEGAPGSKVTVILAWGGHIANRNDWGSVNGVPLSAGGISGSPYHMRLIDWSLGNLGQQDRSLSAAAVIAPPGCALTGSSNVCVGSSNVYSTTEIADSYSWDLINNTSGATFTSITTISSVTVNAGTSAGSYTVKLVTTRNGIPSTDVCEIPVTVSKPARPVVTIQEATLCGTLTAPKLTVSCPVAGTYSLTQTGVAGTRPFIYDGTNGPVEFTNLVAGAGFSITVTVSGCTSDATTCINYTTNVCLLSIPILQGSSSSNSHSGVEDAIGKDITAYPVPFSKKATVEFKLEKSEVYQINLYDMKGTLIKQLKSGKSKAGELQQIEVDGANLAEGMYLVRVVSSQGSKTIKLLKKE